MLFRNFLVVLGGLFVLAGLALFGMWLGQTESSNNESAQSGAAAEPGQSAMSVLAAARPIPSGTLLRPSDLAWKDVEPGEFKPGSLVRGQTSIEEISGAITERDIEAGETLMVDELLLPSDRRFLSAVLRPNMRAVSIAVDAPQSSSGLVLPGDYVDVILTQNLSETAQTLARKSVAETMLRNARVIAVDQSLSKPVRPETADAPVSNSPTKVPETVTLELSERQAEMLFVAMQLGTLQLSVRPLEASGDAPVDDHRAPPTWASDVSPALNEVGGKQPVGSGSSIENLIRRPPAQLF